MFRNIYSRSHVSNSCADAIADLIYSQRQNSTNSITSEIQSSLNCDDLINIPDFFDIKINKTPTPTSTSILTVDSNLNMSKFNITSDAPIVLNNQLSTKLYIDSKLPPGTFLDANNNLILGNSNSPSYTISNLRDPTNFTDAVTLKYLQHNFLKLAGGCITGTLDVFGNTHLSTLTISGITTLLSNLNMNNHHIINVADPANSTDAVNLQYLQCQTQLISSKINQPIIALETLININTSAITNLQSQYNNLQVQLSTLQNEETSMTGISTAIRNLQNQVANIMTVLKNLNILNITNGSFNNNNLI